MTTTTHTTDPAAVLDQARAAGLELWREGERIRWRTTRPPAPPELLDALRAIKPRLRELLPEATPRKRLERAIEVACMACRGVTPHDLASLLDADGRAELEAMADPMPVVVALARSVATTRARQSGRIPTGWTDATTCARCGPVASWPPAPARVDGCPWCHNRARGLPIPRPVSVCCGDCRHFEPDGHRIGHCGIGGQPGALLPDRRRWTYTTDRHRCPRWLPGPSQDRARPTQTASPALRGATDNQHRG